MECPHCHKNMSKSGGGWLCYPAGCGAWIDDLLVIVMPKVPPVEQQLCRPSGKRTRLNPKPAAKHRVEAGKRFRSEVIKRLDEITALRSQGLAWYDIAVRLSKEGFKISYSCLRLHYQAVLGGQ